MFNTFSKKITVILLRYAALIKKIVLYRNIQKRYLFCKLKGGIIWVEKLLHLYRKIFSKIVFFYITKN